jgi:hypothetical protein
MLQRVTLCVWKKYMIFGLIVKDPRFRWLDIGVPCHCRATTKLSQSTKIDGATRTIAVVTYFLLPCQPLTDGREQTTLLDTAATAPDLAAGPTFPTVLFVPEPERLPWPMFLPWLRALVYSPGQAVVRLYQPPLFHLVQHLQPLGPPHLP